MYAFSCHKWFSFISHSIHLMKFRQEELCLFFSTIQLRNDVLAAEHIVLTEEHIARLSLQVDDGLHRFQASVSLVKYMSDHFKPAPMTIHDFSQRVKYRMDEDPDYVPDPAEDRQSSSEESSDGEDRSISIPPIVYDLSCNCDGDCQSQYDVHEIQALAQQWHFLRRDDKRARLQGLLLGIASIPLLIKECSAELSEVAQRKRKSRDVSTTRVMSNYQLGGVEVCNLI